MRELLDEDVENSYQAVVEATPEVAKLVNMQAADDATEAFDKATDQALRGAQVVGTAAPFAALAGAAKQTQTQLFEGLTQRLEGQLGRRISRLQRDMALQLGVTLAGMALAGYLMLAFYRVMMGGLREVSTHLRHITGGDLTTAPRPWGHDEAASVMLDLRAMQEGLQKVVSRVRDSSESIAMASREIAMGAADLSTRTEQNAALVEQTAAAAQTLRDSAELLVWEVAHFRTVDGT